MTLVQSSWIRSGASKYPVWLPVTAYRRQLHVYAHWSAACIWILLSCMCTHAWPCTHKDIFWSMLTHWPLQITHTNFLIMQEGGPLKLGHQHTLHWRKCATFNNSFSCFLVKSHLFFGLLGALCPRVTCQPLSSWLPPYVLLYEGNDVLLFRYFPLRTAQTQ